MHVNKLILLSLASVLLGACAAATEAVRTIESKMLETSKPRIASLDINQPLGNSDRPLYSDLYEMEAKYAGGLVNLPAVQKHLDATLAEVVKVAGYPDFAGRVYILSDPNRLMAHASAEGNIFITLNFLQNVQSQAELSNLIAHEFAHIALGHHDSDMVKNINARVVTAMNGMAKVSAVATSLSEKSQTRLPGNIQSSIEVIEKARFVQDLVAQVISPSWGRQQELEADQLAADISVRLGNSLDESYTWLIRLGKLHDAGNYDKIQVNRVNMRYIEGMQQSLEKAKADSAGLGDMAEGAIATLAYGAVIKAIEYFAQSHSDPNHRKSMLRVYQKNLYLDEEPKDGPAVDEWRKVKGDAEFRDTLKAYLLADEALAQSRKPETRRLAEKTMMQAERLRPKGHVYIWERKVAMYDTLNQPKKMEQSLARGATGDLPALVVNVAASKKLEILLQGEATGFGGLGQTSLVSSLASSINQPAPEPDSQPAMTEEEKQSRLKEIKTLQNELALPVFDGSSKRLPNIQMLLLQVDLLNITNKRKEASAMVEKLFQTYQRPGFLYPRLIVVAGSQDSDLARLQAERLNLECGFLHPEQAQACESALMSL